jgi:hypothetical protein
VDFVQIVALGELGGVLSSEAYQYLHFSLTALRFFVLPTHLFYLGNFYKWGVLHPHPAPLQRFWIFPILGKPD